jgi:hypothetical protein
MFYSFHSYSYMFALNHSRGISLIISRVLLYLFLQDEAIDLLRTVIKLYPSSVNRHYNKVCLIFMFSFPIMGKYALVPREKRMVLPG